MKVKVLKNITHNGNLHLAGQVVDLDGNFDAERLVADGHITLDLTEEDLKNSQPNTPTEGTTTPPATSETPSGASGDVEASEKTATDENKEENESNDSADEENTETTQPNTPTE